MSSTEFFKTLHVELFALQAVQSTAARGAAAADLEFDDEDEGDT